MKLIVDTNCVISALIKSAKSRDIICSPRFTLSAPEHLISEVMNHKQDIIEKSGMTDAEYDELVGIMLSNIAIIPDIEYKKYKEEAVKLAKHEEDIPFLALSLAKNIPIWSNDSDMKQQSTIRVLTTAELLKEYED